MTQKALGKSHRRGISLVKIMNMFPDNDSARKWIERIVWPDGPKCPHCGTNNVQSSIKHKSMTHRCRECEGKPRFSVKTGTVMQSSKLDYRTWAIAAYLVTINIKGISSMKLHRDLEITQKSAWHLAHRLRKAYEVGTPIFSGPVEVDETYMDGKRKNMSLSKRKTMTGRGAVGKTAVVGAKDRDTNQVNAKVITSTDSETLQGFIADNAGCGTIVCTDEARAYSGLRNVEHLTVNHSAGQYVHGEAHTNGIESFRSMLKRGHKGIYHKMSPKHLQRYVNEFSGRHNVRCNHTLTQMTCLVKGMNGKRLRYSELIADNGLQSGAR